MNKSTCWFVASTMLWLPVAAHAQTKLELADALIAAMPQDFRTEEIDRDEQARLEQRNPKKGAAIAKVLLADSKCTTPVINRFTVRLLQNVALSLSEDQIRSLTGFYRSPDFVRFAQLSDKSDAGEVLTETETQFMSKMMAAYPMIDFYNAMQAQQKTAANDEEFIAAVTRCSLDKEAALIKAKITYR